MKRAKSFVIAISLVLGGCMSTSECEQYAAVAKTAALGMCVAAIKEISDEASIDEQKAE